VVLARTLAAAKSAREGDLARFHEEAVVATAGTESWAVLVDADTVLVDTLRPFDAPRVARTRPAPLTERDAALVFEPKGPGAAALVITALVPVPGKSPQSRNVGVSFEPAAVQRVLQDAKEPVPSLVTVLNARQVVMARNRDPGKWLGAPASPAFKSRILAGGVGFAESTTLDGVASLTYLTRPNAHGWSVVVAIPKAALSAQARQASAKVLGASAALLLVLLGAALWGARVISRSVRALTRSAAALGDNEVPARLHTGVPEFDEVAAALHAAGVKAHEANAMLERRVEQAVREAEDAQSKLLHSQKLELVGRLTAGVAHDFNNLLQTISTSHHLLGRRITTDGERRILAAAVRAASKATELVKQLTTLGRAQELKPRLVNVADTVLKGHELTSKAVGTGIVLSASLEASLPDLFVDPTQLEVALLNLVFNARDALPGGGHITISARLATHEEAHAIGPGAFVRLEVADDGTGMSEEVKVRAFEPFFTTKPVGAGTGLGLAQVQAFARQSGGSISLASAPGAGTRVALFLPVADPAMHSAPVAPTRRVLTHQPLRVLMVEDDALVSSVVQSALEGEGHTLRLCKSADEAVQVLRGNEHFDVLFTDVVMPGDMNGIDLVNWCRGQRPELPAVVATGYAENLSVVAATVLRKPYELEALQAALQEARRQPASA
jgi:signal transduction histidine kinase